MSNPLDPDHMTATERLVEVADILAVGLLRGRLRDVCRSTDSRKNRGDSLDDSADLRPYGHEPESKGERP